MKSKNYPNRIFKSKVMSERGYLRMIGKCDKRILSFKKSLNDDSYNEQAKAWSRIMIDRLEAVRGFLIQRYENTRNV